MWWSSGECAVPADCPAGDRDDVLGTDPFPVCGNATIDGTEQCEGIDVGGETCVGLGLPDGTLVCDGVCQFDTSGCGSP